MCPYPNQMMMQPMSNMDQKGGQMNNNAGFYYCMWPPFDQSRMPKDWNNMQNMNNMNYPYYYPYGYNYMYPPQTNEQKPGSKNDK